MAGRGLDCTGQIKLIWSLLSPGPWGRCMGSGCGPGGNQSRTVWCAHSEGWTTLLTNCNQTERPNNQQSCFRVCDQHKDLYDWQLGAWNQCVPISMRSVGLQPPSVCTRGEEGIQTREVSCVQKSGEPAQDAICEYFEPKPRLEQACLIPCPQDCVVSNFSVWTPCSKTCGLGLQNRIRFVLAPPLFGGAACPNLTEFQTCQLKQCEGDEGLYSLRVGPWGPCSIPAPRQARHAEDPGTEGPKLATETEKRLQEGEKPSKGGETPSSTGLKQSGDGNSQLKAAGKHTPEGEKEAGRRSQTGRAKASRTRKLGHARQRPDRPSRQADRPKRQKKAKNKEKREKLRARAQEKLKEHSKVKDPETKELIKKKRNRNRQNRPGGKFWDVQVGYQTREVSCVHKNGNVEALR